MSMYGVLNEGKHSLPILYTLATKDQATIKWGRETTRTVGKLSKTGVQSLEEKIWRR